MSKKYFLQLASVIVLGSISGIFAGGPGAEAWKDSSGHRAPAKVRKAADALWTAVESEGGAAFDAGWGMGKKMQCGPTRACLCICTFGMNECMMAACGKYDEFGYSTAQQADPRSYEAKQMMFEQRTREANEALEAFKEAINNNVVEPEHYSGDANICQLGDWVEDHVWQIKHLFVSGRRDLSQVSVTTMKFVNTHGGWISED